MCWKHHSMQAKDTFAPLSPVCSIPARAFLSCGTSPYYNRSLYHQGGHKPGLLAYHHHNPPATIVIAANLRASKLILKSYRLRASLPDIGGEAISTFPFLPYLLCFGSSPKTGHEIRLFYLRKGGNRRGRLQGYST